MEIINFSEQNSIINQYMAEIRDKSYQKNRLLFRNNVMRIGDFEAALFDHLTVQHPEILEDIRKTGELRPENEAALRAAIESCRAPFTA